LSDQVWIRKEELAEGVTLYLGDMRVVLPTLGRFDACVTDPPYGIGFAAQPTNYQRKSGQKREAWDDAVADIGEIFNCSKCQIVWGGNYYQLPPRRGWLSWFKPDAPPSMASLELAWTSMDQNARQISCSISATNAERVGHPTQKPLAVMLFSLAQLPREVRTIVDPFMGSGTTGVAAVKRGKAFVGIEREPAYFDIACRRISDALRAPDLFVAPAPAAAPKQEAFW
jgi:site-specific DNA-methyltransferase (adenine-specific)